MWARCLHSPTRSQCRWYSGQGPPQVFNREVKQMQKAAAAMSADTREYDYLRDEVALRTSERLLDVTRDFPLALDLGANTGHMLRSLQDGRGGIQELVMTDDTPEALYRDDGMQADSYVPNVCRRVVDDEHIAEAFEQDSFDLVLSAMSLGWANDLPGCMMQARHVLKPDGLFVAAIMGGKTLSELRSAFVVAEQERDGGVSPHIAPMVDVRSAGDLLGRSGFTLPAVDSDEIVVMYDDAWQLMHHLRAMGASSCIMGSRVHVPLDTMIAIAAIYDSMFRTPHGIPATFQVIYMTGWVPHDSQPKPMERGTGDVSMTDLAQHLGKDVDFFLEDDANSPAAGTAK